MTRTIRSLLALLVLVAYGASTPARSQSVHRVDGHVSAGDPQGIEPARRAWLQSGGEVNGITGFVFVVEPSTIGGGFTIRERDGEDLRFRIDFYSDLSAGTLCRTVRGTGGTPCGRHAIATSDSTRADLSFVYEAEPPQPALPDYSWQPPAGRTPAGHSYVYLSRAKDSSTVGDFEFVYEQRTALLQLSPYGHGFALFIRGDEHWQLLFTPQDNSRGLSRRLYTFSPMTPGNGRFSAWGPLATCLPSGVLAVDDIAYGVGGAIERATIRFEARCPRASTLYGKIRWDRSEPPPHRPDPGPAPLWQPPPGSTPVAGSYFYVEGIPPQSTGRTLVAGDYMNMFVNDTTIRMVSDDPGHWSADFILPIGATSRSTSWFPDARRAYFHNPRKGGLTVAGHGLACNESTGWFSIDTAKFSAAGDVVDLVVRFELGCLAPLWRGKLRWTAPALPELPLGAR